MRLRYTVRALAELHEILAYIAERSPAAARRVQARLHSVTMLLTLFPHSGQRTTSRHHPQRRRHPATPYPYVVFYDVREQEIVIVAVRHMARNPSSSLGMP